MVDKHQFTPKKFQQELQEVNTYQLLQKFINVYAQSTAFDAQFDPQSVNQTLQRLEQYAEDGRPPTDANVRDAMTDLPHQYGIQGRARNIYPNQANTHFPG